MSGSVSGEEGVIVLILIVRLPPSDGELGAVGFLESGPALNNQHGLGHVYCVANIVHNSSKPTTTYAQ